MISLEVLSNDAHMPSDLQKKALEYVTLFKGKAALDILADIYTNAAGVEIKESIIDYLMIAGGTRNVSSPWPKPNRTSH
ncbi:MAG: hypothetical protein M2R45_05163 [Verrucomicrobia subdivision 3 bacterium]|nr:hypothetical protein [Limisphaerales bacterium]MCS1413806.1 hypothetical protein [Limisphaerales bacterium]